MNREEKLLRNSALFAFGIISGKFMQFLLLPFYTHMLTSEQYGQIDLLQNIAVFLLPLVSLCMADGVFRYAMDAEEDPRAVFSIGIAIVGIGGAFSFLLMQTVEAVFHISDLRLVWGYIVSNALFGLISQFAKAMEKNTWFAVSKVLYSTGLCAASIVFLRFLHWGVYGYFYSYIFSGMFCAALLFFGARLWRYVSFTEAPRLRPLAVRMLRFCMPLIPNAACWWVMNFSDRMMIAGMYGYHTVGIYAAAYKIPTIIAAAMNVFFSAWQISANQEYQARDARTFFSRMYLLLQRGLVAAAALMMLGAKFLCAGLFSESYYDAWRYIPVMLLGVAAFSLAQFLGSVYSAAKRTDIAFLTNMTTAALNVVLNFVLLRSIGAYGAALATTVSFFILWWIRAWSVRALLRLQFSWSKTAVNFALLSLEALAVTRTEEGASFFAAGLTLLIFILNLRPVMSFLRKVIKRAAREERKDS